MRQLPVFTLMFVAAATVAAAQQASRPVVAAAHELSTLTLVKSADGKAVVRFGRSELQVLSVGDRVGKTEAAVTTIAPGRLVLEEVTTSPDGKPLRAQILVRDGETGGKKFLRHPDMNAPVGLRPEIVDPADAATNSKKKPEPRR
jgi:hypothetical protein